MVCRSLCVVCCLLVVGRFGLLFGVVLLDRRVVFVVGCWLLSVACWLLVGICCLVCVYRCLLLFVVVCCCLLLLFVVCCSLLVGRWSLFVVRDVLFVARCL